MDRLSWSQKSSHKTNDLQLIGGGGMRRSEFHFNVPSLLFSCLVSCRNPAVLHHLQFGASQPLPAGMAHIFLHVYTFVYVQKKKRRKKNSIKPEEDLSVIRHTCRQPAAAATIAIRSQQPQIVFLKHQAAATLMQSGLSGETALIAGFPASESVLGR